MQAGIQLCLIHLEAQIGQRLNQGGRADGEAARSLVADLKQWSGVTLQDSIYAQVAQRVARGAR